MSDALKLADALSDQWNQLDPADPFRADVGKAAAELRRLHAENADLLAALKQIVTLYTYAFDTEGGGLCFMPDGTAKFDAAFAAVEAAIAKAEGA